MAYLKLTLFGLISPLLVVLIFLLNKIKKFHALNYWVKQVIYGVLFGGVAILCTEFGVKNGSVILNVRDSAVIAAGLIYGWPAGIISGVIGGVERYFSTFWTGATYTQIACSISTIISGVGAGLFRKFVFGNKRCTWYQCFLVGAVLETSHILMIFITNMDDVVYAFSYVRQIGNPMIVGVAVSVMVSAMVMDILRFKEKREERKKDPWYKGRKWKLSTILHSLLFSIITFAYVNVALYTYNIQNRIAKSNASALLENAVTDMANDILATSDENLLNYTRNTQNFLEVWYNATQQTYVIPQGFLDDLVVPTSTNYAHVSEINYVEENGIIKYSTGEWAGWNMRLGEQSNEFVTHLLYNKEQEYVQEYRAISADGSIQMKYAGRRMEHGGFIQLGYSTDLYYEQLEDIIDKSVSFRHVGENGLIIITDKDFNIVSHTITVNDYERLSDLGFHDDLTKKEPFKMYSSSFNLGEEKESMRYLYEFKEGYYIIGMVSEYEVTLSRNMTIYVTSYLQLITFALVFSLIYVFMNRFVLREMDKVNGKLQKITSGDLNVYFDINSSHEFEILSESINDTVGALKGFIEKESKNMEKELALAKAIQLSSLPSKLAYLYQHNFGVYATMKTAKQVGGDFYDYFQLSDGKFVIVIADVSGKGVPAALFMMRAKSLIKSFLETGMSIGEAIDRSNKKLCEGNEAEMFVTCWAATIDTKTGVMEFVNAGHNPPLIRREGKYEYLKTKPNFVLGAMEMAPYTKHTLELQPGDVVFLYTDGITEAQNVNGEFYGEDRLKETINGIHTLSPEKITKKIIADTLEFTGEHEQSDDMTLLTFAYYGPETNQRFFYDGVIEEYEHARADLTKVLQEHKLDDATIDKFILCLEEIFVNIVTYGYADKKGQVILDVSTSDIQVSITFTDTGKYFNPLAKDDPDITLPAQEREIGGLGIFMVKNIMDSIYYTYQDGRNILTMSMFFLDKKED